MESELSYLETMPLIIGKLKFNPDNETFTAFIEANGIAENKKVAVFLSPCFVTCLHLHNHGSIASMIATLKGHFEPKPLIITEQFNFLRRSRPKVNW